MREESAPPPVDLAQVGEQANGESGGRNAAGQLGGAGAAQQGGPGTPPMTTRHRRPSPWTTNKENILVPRPPNLSTRFQAPPGNRKVLQRIACRIGAALAGGGAATQKGSPTPSNSLYAPRATPDAPRSASRAFSSP